MNRRAVGLVLVVGLLAVALGGYFSWQRFAQRPAIDSLVEEIFTTRFKDASGTQITLGTYRNKVVLMNFWATWCAPCVEEMPELSELQVELVNRGVQVIGMGVDSAGKVAKFSQEVKVLYPLLVLGASGIELSQRLGNANGALPFTVVINRNGEIIERKLGRIDKARMRRVILRVLETGQ